MELDWTTIILEVVNFLVLVWILKHFLYQPVLDVVERRRAAVEETLAEAAKREESAEKLRRQFEGRLEAWQREKQAAQEKLQRELTQERSSAEGELRASLDAERERLLAIARQEELERARLHEQEALKGAAKFASRLLGDLSGPDLEKRIVNLACAELVALPEEQRRALRNSRSDSIVVHSAYPLDEQQRDQLREALGTVVDRSVDPTFEHEPGLLAGVRIVMGDWTVGANLRDELTFFAERALDES
jgi:F-type H+-transporting ATPase subunit b